MEFSPDELTLLRICFYSRVKECDNYRARKRWSREEYLRAISEIRALGSKFGMDI